MKSIIRPAHRIYFAWLACALCILTSGAFAQTEVVQSRGVDARVDYASLLDYGPWDDRNYQLTAEDIALLAPNEADLRLNVPAFYRVHMRRTMDLPTTGKVQYPRSATPRFLNRYGGILIDGKVYRKVSWTENGYVLNPEEAMEPASVLRANKALQGEARVSSPNDAAESAIKINPVNTNLVIAGSNGPGGGQKMHYSSDGGVTWTESAALPQGGTCCDPTVDWSSDGTKAYAATLGNGVYIYRSGDNGQTWDDLNTEPGGDPRREIGVASSDKEYIHVDKFATSPYLDNIYLTWHEGNTMYFSRSTDMAHTWVPKVALSSGSDERGIGSDITTDKNGHVYYAWPAFNSQKILVRKSTDGGATFQPTVEVADTQASFEFQIPAMDTRLVFVYLSADADLSDGPYGNSLYMAWTDSTAATGGTPSNNHGRIQVAYSRNGGADWTLTTPHETADANTVDRFHPWLAVGPDGTVHVVYYDTRRDVTRQSVDFFHSFSTDGAQTWSTPERLTSVQSPKINDFFEWGDYNGLDVVMNDLIAIFTDNRDESGGSAESVDVYAAGKSVGSSEIFSDDFEGGDTSNWTAVP